MALSGFRKIFDPEPKRLDPLTNFGPDTVEKVIIPRDTGLDLEFPSEAQDPQNRIIYALWKEGEQPFSNLVLLSGLGYQQAKGAVNSLLEQNRIQQRNLSSSGQFKYQVYFLNK